MNKVTLLAALGLFLSLPCNAAPPKLIVDLKENCLLGASQQQSWIKPEAVAALGIKSHRYAVYSFDRFLLKRSGGKPESLGAPCDETLGVRFQKLPGSANLALSDAADFRKAFPRQVRLQRKSIAVYKKIILQLLIKKGFNNPVVNIVNIFRTDLDGDGVQEVLVQATNFSVKQKAPPPGSSKGDYSLILFRYLVKGKLKQQVVMGNFFKDGNPHLDRPDAPAKYYVGAIQDINGDGRMEVLLRGMYYEGTWSTLYEFGDSGLKEVLSCGCGL